MAGSNINAVTLTGNLTKDPELKTLPGGSSVCRLRLACNGRRKNAEGSWVDDPNYFDVIVWGKQGENAAQYLAKGRPVAVTGRLNWREWNGQDNVKHQTVEVVASFVQFLSSKDEGSNAVGAAPQAVGAGAGAGWGDEDSSIPF